MIPAGMTSHRDPLAALPPAALAAALERDLPAPARLRGLLADPHTRAPALLHLRARLAAATTPAERDPLIALLPRELAGLRPELQRLLADMHLSAATWSPGHVPTVLWRETPGLLPAVALAWSRLELSLVPTRIDPETLTLAALRGLQPADLRAPDRLLPLLLRAAAPTLQREGLRLLIGSLHAALLAPARAAALLLELLADESRARDPAVAAVALRHLGEAWAHAFPCPRGLLLRHLHGAIDKTIDDIQGDPGPEQLATLAARHDRALAAIDLAARQHLDADLRALAHDPDIAGSLRRAAFLAAAPRCERDALHDWLLLAAGDPPLFGPVLLPTLRILHRRGIFVHDTDLPAILELCAIDPTIDPSELAARCYTARHALLRHLRSAPAHDPRWPRWLPLLAALESDEVPPLLRELLAQDPPPQLRRDLLRALARLRDTLAEPQVLALLTHDPANALTTLRAIGGPATITTLRRELGLDTFTVAPHLRADEADALALLWHLLPEDDPTRELLCARLDPASCPPQISRDLGHPTPFQLALLLTCAPDPTAVVALQRLAATGSRLAVPLARDLLRRVLSEVVAGTLVEHHGRAERPAPTDHPSEAQRQIPTSALAAIRHLGERLHERGAIRPACLLTTTPEDAGLALLAELLLELAADAPDPDTTTIALQALTPLAVPDLARKVHRYLRHHDARVRAAAIACLARHGVDDLCASLTRLAHSDDIIDARQALQALGDAGADAAAATIAAWLEHPNMNLKKVAAGALRRAGSPEVAPTLVRWLGQHDNPGLRSSLSAALTAILGDAATATLIAALDTIAPDDPDAARRRRLLILALDHNLTPALVHAIARRDAPWLPPLLAALRDGAIHLRSGALADLAPWLPAPPPTTPTVPTLRPAIAGLLADGFSPAHAAALLADPHQLTAQERAAIRPYLREWLSALATNIRTLSADNLHTFNNLHTPQSPALALILQLAADGLTPPELALAAPSIDALAAHLDHAPREPLLALLDAIIPRLPPLAAWQLADHLRSSTPRPHTGTLWLARLRRCGVLPTPADLERALDDCAGTPDPAALAREILRDALTLPPLTADEQRRRKDLSAALATLSPHHPELTPSLRVELYPELPNHARPAWLAALLHERPLGLPAPTPVAPTPHTPEPHTLPRLLARLQHPDASERQRAAAALSTWPAASARPTLLTAYLAGDIELAPPLLAPLAATLAETPELVRSAEQDPARLTRLAELLLWLPNEDRQDHAPLLLRWWAHGPDAARPKLAMALRSLGPMRLRPLLEPHLRAGEWSHAELLQGEVTATPEWLTLLEQAPPELAATLRARTVPAPLGPRDQHTRTLAALAQLLHPLPPPPPPPLAASPAALRERLHSADPEAIRHALTDMSHAPGPDWPDLLDELVDHPSPRVRLHAHRLLRASGERERYLAATRRLLTDPRSEIQRMAMRALAHADDAAAVAPLVERLARDHDPQHREVIAALRRLGPLARPALLHARGRARPDRRAHYDELLATIAADHDGR